MNEIFEWFMVLANAKIVSMLILMVTFISILIYVYGSKKRSKRFEEYRNIPFLDDDQDIRVPQSDTANETSQLKGEK
ncbi:MAG: cbb3-type cytochrome c oxidase subunit 3 [Cocleimonas sp.]